MSPCVQVGHVNINVPDRVYIRKIMACPKCKGTHRFTGWHSGLWYSIEWTCHNCGIQFCDSEYRKPSKSRKPKVIQEAKAQWVLAMNWRDFCDWLRGELERVSA